MSRGQKCTLTPKQERWLINHFKHSKNAECAEVLGISPRTVVRIAKSFGLTKSRQFIAKCRQVSISAANASNLSNHRYPPKGFKIPNREAGQFKPGVSNLERLGKKRELERQRKAAESLRATIKKERARIVWGFEQKTKLKLTTNPKRIQCRYELRKHGYQITKGGYEAYIEPHTRRSPKLEDRARQHGIRVIEKS